MKTYGESLVAQITQIQREMNVRFNDIINKESPMKTYIGIKTVVAEPATKTFPIDDEGGTVERSGYKVVYPDGYVSWSPADAFEEAYVEVEADRAANVLEDLRFGLRALTAPESSDEAADRIFGEQQDAGPTHDTYPVLSFGKPDPEWVKQEREREAIERRSLAISYALQATAPVHSMQQQPKQRTVEGVVEAATAILAFMEGGAAIAPSKPPA